MLVNGTTERQPDYVIIAMRSLTGEKRKSLHKSITILILMVKQLIDYKDNKIRLL